MLLQSYLLLLLVDMYLCIDLIYQVEEGKRPDTFVGDIAVDSHLLDTVPVSDHNQFQFSLLHELVMGEQQLFRVTPAGKLYTAQELDAEALCKYNTECFTMVEIAVQHKESFVKILDIKVVVEDGNDFEPEFSVDQFNIYFSEREGKGSRISIPNAIDRDVGALNSKITYQLKSNINEPFRLSVLKQGDGTSKLAIILEERLNKEVKDTYLLQVIARDGGSPPKQGILNIKISVTDENDNSPIFSRSIYNVTVNSRHRQSVPIVTLSATDLDSGKNGNISYHFSSKTPDLAKSHFMLDHISGDIFLNKRFTLNEKQTYKLFIEARDGGSPSLSSTAVVLVNVVSEANNAPRIDVKFVSKSSRNKTVISEGVETGSFIAYVKVTDNDIGRNGEISCRLQHDNLQLKSLSKNKYKVVIKKPVDREKQKQIEFTIICEDKGSPSLKTKGHFSIQVMDVNDVQPLFSKDTFKFLTYENEKPHFPIGFINVTDPDLGSGSQLNYTLFSNDRGILPFEISDFGFISTAQSLDREKQDIYKFRVFVKDNGTPPLNNTADVIVEVIDENDNPPYFSFPSVNPFSLDVHYHPQSKNDITVLRALDKDIRENAFLRFEILRGNDKQLFSVNPYSGVLSFSRKVYQNDAGSYNLQLAVKDSGTPALSATTTLSLTLTVSNKTSTMLTALQTLSDDKIHINLVIIIVIAAVTLSTAIVVSIAICIIQRNNQKEIQYNEEFEISNKFLSDSEKSKYFHEPSSSHTEAQLALATDLAKSRNSPATIPRRDTPTGFKSTPDHTWRGCNSGKQVQAVAEEEEETYSQKTAVPSKIDDKKDHLTTNHFRNWSTTFSDSDTGCGWKEGDTARLYEELPDYEKMKHHLGVPGSRISIKKVHEFQQPSQRSFVK
ncbi:putative protocadherin beta-18 isoform X2 [Octopus bimaculoides]|uniref:putative protocadherin beta-18 isoform X2 n=1 Tax=Octopus bimaculoides TaxID=37653 RepID=UPI00071D2EE6|nr:putative protocadherin beta-18 isoform X2 [Octopus bimaculoides]|eukprot:XP_014777134.1 PREDICTED: putative protocadherin beta-18 isoform X2 [Octopus bimaculoides]